MLDAKIRDQVRQELAWDSRVPDSNVRVEVGDRVVVLSGTVGSEAARYAAEETAFHVMRVHDVVNQLEVRPADEHTDVDEDLREAIERVLQWDALVPAEQIRFHVKDGFVTLSGAVHVMRQKEEAERAVRHLVGVRGLKNRIAVEPAEVDEEDVRERIRQALEKHGAHLAKKIDVLLADGTAILTGTVDSARERRAVVGAVGHAPGVVRLVDRIEVEAP